MIPSISTSLHINEAHPLQHKELYSAVPVIVRRAVSMFEQVLVDLTKPLLLMRIVTSDRRWLAKRLQIASGKRAFTRVENLKTRIGVNMVCG